MSIRVAVVSVLVGLLLAGCSRDIVWRGGDPMRGDTWRSCAEEEGWSEPRRDADGRKLPLIDSTTTAVAVIVCASDIRQRPDGLSEEVVTEHRAEDVTALLAALRLPDEKVPRDLNCGDVVEPMPWLALFDRDGRWLRPGVPLDACRQPRREVRDAVAALPVTLVRSRVTALMNGSDAAREGCSARLADPFVDLRVTPGAPPPELTLSADLTRCVYTRPVNDYNAGPTAGVFARGGQHANPLTLTRLLREAPPAPACTARATSFAQLRSGAAPEVLVELDGCTRILVTGVAASVAQASPVLVALLT